MKEYSLEERAALEFYVRRLLGTRKADMWWKLKNPMLGDMTPNQLLQLGRANRLYAFIDAAREANGDTSDGKDGL